MFYRIALAIICTPFLFAANARSQQINPDPNTQLQADSVRALDSGYRARKAQFDKWVMEQRVAAAKSPQEDFLSVYAGYGGFLPILARDLNQFFSERALRHDPSSDRNLYGVVDREIILAGQAQLAKTWGIYVEYDFTAKFSNTIVDSITKGPQNLAGAEEELDLYEHSLVVGGLVIIYSGPFYRLRAEGGYGAVYALTSETESPSKAVRSASAIGNQVNFDLLNDFRITPKASFTIDFLFRTVTTGELKTSSGETIHAPFGVRTAPLTIKPTASNIVYGAAAGLIFYF